MSEMGSRPAAGIPPVAPPETPLLVEVTTSSWERRAARVGTVAGNAVAILRRARRRWYQFDPHQAASDAADTLRRETRARSADLRQTAAELRETARIRGAELRDRAVAGYEQTRARAERVGRDYPAQVVLVAAATGFIVGAGLRVWRSRRAA
jgi:ElaB/YqjD/DUF883 family membrane-anchored ribosome-binding protein